MKWKDLQNEDCPVARGLSVMGDRWTLLLLRDCFLGVRRFDDFQKNLGVTRHVLADRLKLLCDRGVLEKRPYQDRPKRYEYKLTEKGKAFFPVLMTLINWADEEFPTDSSSPYEFVARDTGKKLKPELTDANTGERLELRNIIRKVSGQTEEVS
ncbi:winged helix-turn-helix transcriptional regulator [Sneathiella limimaris]|uniref:winged helix-turn-helix transcriptional regulator n=1 Tax=Sneathiella limimaris TaxID=1964213 RepID=UPI00146D7FC1|nr:helix-turn-helix domain-containing protein [Sneathiella limimaris]